MDWKCRKCSARDSPETRIIFISGRDDASVRQVALEAGGFRFPLETVRRRKLLQLVRKRGRGLTGLSSNAPTRRSSDQERTLTLLFGLGRNRQNFFLRD